MKKKHSHKSSKNINTFNKFNENNIKLNQIVENEKRRIEKNLERSKSRVFKKPKIYSL